MISPVAASSSWSTASYGDAANTSPMELSALSDHLDLCHGARGRLFSVRCAADTVHRFMAARLVTTVLLLGLVVVAGAMAV